jgi:hypothetical protein
MKSLFRRLYHGQEGQVLYLVAALMIGFLGLAALSIDIGFLLHAQRELQANTDAAASAGGSVMPNPSYNPQTVAYQYSGDAQLGTTDKITMYNVHPDLNITGVTVSFACVSGSTATNLNMPPCAVYGNNTNCTVTGGCNAIQVTETASEPTFFAKVFGISTVKLTATSTASASGGGAIPYHVMLLLDSTASMGQGTDTGCLSSKTSQPLSPEQCAQEGIQTLLTGLAPCSPYLQTCQGDTNGLYSNSVDEVGLMTFPGLCSQTLSNGNCPTATSLTDTSASPYAPDDYSCPASDPPITSYNNDPAYLILPFQSDYRTSDYLGLNTGKTGSNLVKSVGGVTDGTCTGIQTPGGEGTFYAGGIKAAQDYLTAYHSSGVQDILIFLSDGDATACGDVPGTTKLASGCTKNQMAGSVTSYPITNECQQAVTAATNAKNAGIEIYSISYGSEKTGCTYDQSPYGTSGLTPCETMSAIATSGSTSSGSGYFFSVPQTINNQTSTVCAGAVPITSLDQVFNVIVSDLFTSRMIPNGVF